MRLALALALVLATPAVAWEFTPVPVCTLSHAQGAASAVVTYDPRKPQPYAIALTAPEPWPASPLFALRFDGPHGMTLTTDRHLLSGGGRTLTVTDSGFGNVLDGIEFNRLATALTAGSALAFPLDGAAEPTRAFRACTEAMPAA